MEIRAIHTAESIAAVNKIKRMTSKNFDLGVSLKTPDEFIEKRNYMQSTEFLKDRHNAAMFNIIDRLIKSRDEITSIVEMMNKTQKGKVVQGINGFARYKSDLEKNYSLNFDNRQTLNTTANTRYSDMKDLLRHYE